MWICGIWGQFRENLIFGHQGRSQTLNPGWARKQHFFNFSSSSRFSLIFHQFSTIFFLNLGLRVGGPPTREGPGYATVCQKLLNCSSNLKILLHMCDTYNCGYLKHSTFRFNFIEFQLKVDFPFPILRFFTVKSPSVTQRSVPQENAFKKSKNPSPVFLKSIGSNNYFTLIENNFWFLR